MKRLCKRLISIITILALLSLCIIPAYATINGIFLGSDENGVNILNDKLRPGDEYYFPVLIGIDAIAPTQLTSADLERSKLEVRVVTGGKAIASAKVEEKNGLVYVCIIPGSKGTVQELTSTIRVNYRNRDTGDNITVTPAIKVGYPAMPEGTVEALEPGEFLELDNLTPIVSAKQWNALAELNEYRDVTLSGFGWRYTVNTTKLGKRNMVTDHHPVMDLVKKYPNHQMHFIGFPGEPDFEVPGKLWLDVGAFAEEYKEDFYLYRCAYGKIYPLKFDYDKDAMEISFRPSQLSTYVITDKRLDTSTSSSQPDSSTETLPPAENPNTGESRTFPALLVALVSLAGLGALTRSRRS
ncbi:MAG: LPXTG cell wall anchor domain-containing protein [Angelakisella sp.]